MSNTTPISIKPGMIYLIQEREFVNKEESVFKIGRTQNIWARMSKYPKGSQIISCNKCNDTVAYESHLIGVFCHKFKARPDIGREYFVFLV